MALQCLLHVGELQGTVVGTLGGDSQSPYHGIFSVRFTRFSPSLIPSSAELKIGTATIVQNLRDES